MFTVAVLAQNGGVGKTTLAVTLAVLAELEGLTSGVVDADPSANAFGWHQRRVRVTGKTTPPFAVASSPESLRVAVETARADGLQWLFVDTGAGVAELPAIAAELANLVLIPCIGSANKIAGCAPTARLVKRLAKPGFFVVNLGSSSKAINDACAMALTSTYGLPAAAAHITDRKPVRYAENDGLALPEVPNPDATTQRGASEFRALWRWLLTQKQSDGDVDHDQEKPRRAVR